MSARLEEIVRVRKIQRDAFMQGWAAHWHHTEGRHQSSPNGCNVCQARLEEYWPTDPTKRGLFDV